MSATDIVSGLSKLLASNLSPNCSAALLTGLGVLETGCSISQLVLPPPKVIRKERPAVNETIIPVVPTWANSTFLGSFCSSSCSSALTSARDTLVPACASESILSPAAAAMIGPYYSNITASDLIVLHQALQSLSCVKIDVIGYCTPVLYQAISQLQSSASNLTAPDAPPPSIMDFFTSPSSILCSPCGLAELKAAASLATTLPLQTITSVFNVSTAMISSGLSSLTNACPGSNSTNKPAGSGKQNDASSVKNAHSIVAVVGAFVVIGAAMLL